MNVSLTPELENFVQEKVASGRFPSVNDVFREALHLLEEHEQARNAELKEFQDELDRRLASLDAGKGIPGKTVFAEIRAKSEARRRHKEAHPG